MKIASKQELDQFGTTWKYHHPLSEAQLAFADRIAKVKKVGFYHGGGELYILDGIPGIWHEECLKKSEKA